MTLSLPRVSRMVSVEVLDSTQNLARELVRQGTPDATLVLAYEQTGGRGQYERTWDAARGGIYFTLVLQPQKPVCYNARLSIKTAEAVCAALEKLFGFKTKIKHPNDVLVWEEKTRRWKKICGILTESFVQEGCACWLLVGVGINVNNPLPRTLKDSATSVKKLVGHDMPLEFLLQETLDAFWVRYAQWKLSSQI